MENTEIERLIGNCLEINSDIVQMRLNTKFYNIIDRFKVHKYTIRLMKTVKKITKSNTPLNKNNLVELFSYIYSSFPPHGSYKNILQTMHVSKGDLDLWKCVIKYQEGIIYVIDIDMSEDLFTLTMIVNDEEKQTRIDRTVYLGEMYTSKEEMSDNVANLNKLLNEIISDYILYAIESTKHIERKVSNE